MNQTRFSDSRQLTGKSIFSLSDFDGSVSISVICCRSGEMADALDSKSSGGNTMRVQLPPPALLEFLISG